MANIKVTSKQDAWNKVNQIFPTDYEQDVQSSTRAVFYFTEEYLKELENKAKEDEAVAAMQANSSKDGPVQCMVLTAEGNANVMLDCIKELHRAVHILLDKQEDVDEWMLSGITAMMDRANEMKIIPYDLPTSICGLLCAQYR